MCVQYVQWESDQGNWRPRGGAEKTEAVMRCGDIVKKYSTEKGQGLGYEIEEIFIENKIAQS